MRILSAMAIILSLVCLSGAVRAQVESQELLPPTRSTLTAAAKEIVDAGNAYFGIQEYSTAARKYALAWGLTGDASLAYDVALCLWYDNDLFEARHWMKVYYSAFERQLKRARTAWDERGIIGEQPYRLNERIVLGINDFMHDAGWDAHTSTWIPMCRKETRGCPKVYSLVSEDRYRDLCRTLGSCASAERAIAREKAMLGY